MSVPPVLVIAPEMGALVGNQAERFATAGVGAVFRDFFGRVGDPVPVVGSDGSARLGADLVAMTIGGVLRCCTTRSDLAQLVIAHPSDWGPYEMSILHSALTCTEAEGVPTSLVSSPAAAVTAAVAAGSINPSETALVADIGSDGTEVALVTGENHAGRLAATSRTNDLSATGLDRALARHVLEQVRGHLPDSDLTNPANRTIIRNIVADCRRARADLVRHAVTTIDVRLAAQRVPVRIIRAEFESLAREPVYAGLSTIAQVMRQARDKGIEVAAIVLTGEAAHTPLLTELISAHWPCRVIIPPCPEWAAASGAAQIAMRRCPVRLSSPLSPSPRPAVRQTPATGERRWTLRWGALQLSAALVSRAVPGHG
ncbi:MAG TPA: Hsp70 family protein [Pseudonocardiaceae bacterium]|nr:Hsp70 family protein [Pseudonocardiaceae bacterium]